MVWILVIFVYIYDDLFQVKASMNSADAFTRLKEPALLK